jgi:hypothetical protein
MNHYKNKGKGIEWPLEWEQCNDMFQYLQRMTWGYQLNLEKKMFATQYGAEYRCSLVKWVSEDNKPILDNKKREVLLETTDPAQMEAALFMLINEVEVQYKAAKNRVSMVP